MLKNYLMVIKRRATSFWLGSIWFLAWLIACLTGAILILINRNDLLEAWVVSIVLILGHLLFFIMVRHRLLLFFALLIQILSLGFFVNCIWMLNAEGTTWGAGPASIGLVCLIPAVNAFLGAARSRQDRRIGWYAFVTGIIGISATLWRMYEVHQKLKAGFEFWTPLPFYQNIGLFFSILLVIAGLLHFLMKDSIKAVLVKSDGDGIRNISDSNLQKAYRNLIN